MAEPPGVPTQGCWGACRCAQWVTKEQLLQAAKAHSLDTQKDILSISAILWGNHPSTCTVKLHMYLQNVHWLAGILVLASVCRTVNILCFWHGRDGAVHTQWTAPPAPIKTPCQTKWHCRLSQHPKYWYTPPLGQISTHTAPLHTTTTLRMQPETKKRARKVNDSGDIKTLWLLLHTERLL